MTERYLVGITHSCGHKQTHDYDGLPLTAQLQDEAARPCSACCVSPEARAAIAKANAPRQKRDIWIEPQPEGWWVRLRDYRDEVILDCLCRSQRMAEDLAGALYSCGEVRVDHTDLMDRDELEG